MTDMRVRDRIGPFVRELRRRRVFRVAAAYMVVGFGVAVAAQIFFPVLLLPAGADLVVAILVVLGFPVALVLAWIYDITSQGVRRSPPVRRDVPWDDLQALFAKAAELPPGERNAFIERESGQDPDLAAELRSLLAAHDQPGLLEEWGEKPPKTRMEGQRLRQYEILENIGAGAMGVIHKARDTRLGRIVAVKFLSPDLVAHEEAKQRFLIEARAAASLDHPNVCTIHEVGESEDGRLFIVMTYYEGQTVRARIRRGGISVAEALDIVRQASRGLAAAAERGVIHRDVKPANLLLTEDGTVKIVDFGIAKTETTDLTRPGAWIGTASYMSPEQARGESVDQRADVWALGVILYEMLAGQRPFRGRTDYAVVHAILNTPPTPLAELVPDLAPGIVGIVERAMNPRVDGRYPGAADLAADLETALESPDQLDTNPPGPSLSPEGERRGVTVLAISIQGYEELLDSHDPAVVDDVLRRLYDRAAAVVSDFGGVLNERTEEMLVALFGVPLTYGDDALRAVRAAARLGQELDEDGDGPSLRLRSAIGSHLASVRVSAEGHRQYVVGGQVVGDVSRLATFARDGEILLEPELAHFVEPFIRTDVHDPVILSGDGATISPLIVMGESGVGSRLDALAPAELTPFAGRTVELETLRRALAGAQRGDGRTVAVVGGAGVGKSRLLHEFRRSLAEDDLALVRGRCNPHGVHTPYLPFVGCLCEILNLTEEYRADDHDRMVQAVRTLSPELEGYIPVILHLLSTESDEFPLPPYLKGDDLRAVIGQALCSVVIHAARRTPLVVLFEDWHWADGGSSEVLDELAELVTVHPVLIVVASRPEREAEAALACAQTRLDLDPLDPVASEDLVRSTLGAERVPADLAERVVEKTGGNPFFIEELCRTLLESGTVVVQDGEANAAHSLEGHRIPDTVQAVLRGRLDRLDPEAREVLRSASVIGRSFGLNLLTRIVPSPSRVPAALKALRSAGLVHRTDLGPEPMYRFKHALVLDVAYDNLFDRQRRERHGRVGEAIEELYPERLDEYSERLAEHYGAAGLWDRAVKYGRVAADRSSALWRIDDAIRMLGRVREWIGRQSVEPDVRREALAQVLLELERHLESTGGRHEQQEIIDELFGLFQDEEVHPRLAELHLRQGELYTLMSRSVDAGVSLNLALDMAKALNDEKLRSMAVRAIAHLHWNRGEYDLALPPLEDLVRVARTRDDPSGLLRDLLNLGRVLREKGDTEGAFEIAEEAKALSRRSAHLGDLTYLQNYLGHLYKSVGRSDEALEAFSLATRFTKEAHMPVRHAFNLMGTGTMQLELGRTEEAFSAYREAIELVRKNRPDMAAHGYSLIGDGHMALGEAGEAIPQYRESVRMLTGLGNPGLMAHAVESLAKALEAAGHPEAVDRWMEARSYHHESGNPVGVLTSLEHEAGLLRAEANRSRELFREAAELASELGDTTTGARVRNSLALIAWREGDLESAEVEYRSALRLLETDESSGDLGVVLNGLGVVLTRMGRLEEGRDVLNRAESVNAESNERGRHADSLAALGANRRESGDLTLAYDFFHQCLDVRRDSGDRAGEGWALLRLAELSRDAGADERAARFRTDALEIAREIGDAQLEERCGTGGATEQ